MQQRVRQPYRGINPSSARQLPILAALHAGFPTLFGCIIHEKEEKVNTQFANIGIFLSIVYLIHRLLPLPLGEVPPVRKLVEERALSVKNQRFLPALPKGAPRVPCKVLAQNLSCGFAPKRGGFVGFPLEGKVQ